MSKPVLHFQMIVCDLLEGESNTLISAMLKTLTQPLIVKGMFKVGTEFDTTPNCLTLCLPVSSADNLGKQFGPRSDPTNHSSGLIRVQTI